MVIIGGRKERQERNALIQGERHRTQDAMTGMQCFAYLLNQYW